MLYGRLRFDIAVEVGVVHEFIWERSELLIILHDLVKESECLNGVVKSRRYGPFALLQLRAIIKHGVEG